MNTYEVTENGQVFTMTKMDTGCIIKELKMSDEQKAIIAEMQAAAQAAASVDPLVEVKTKLDKLIADLTEVKADVKMIKAKG